MNRSRVYMLEKASSKQILNFKFFLPKFGKGIFLVTFPTYYLIKTLVLRMFCQSNCDFLLNVADVLI